MSIDRRRGSRPPGGSPLSQPRSSPSPCRSRAPRRRSGRGIPSSQASSRSTQGVDVDSAAPAWSAAAATRRCGLDNNWLDKPISLDQEGAVHPRSASGLVPARWCGSSCKGYQDRADLNRPPVGRSVPTDGRISSCATHAIIGHSVENSALRVAAVASPGFGRTQPVAEPGAIRTGRPVTVALSTAIPPVPAQRAS